MNDELKALREEIAKLRERVAVLEAQPKQTVHLNPREWAPVIPMTQPPMQPPHWLQPHTIPPYTVTCGKPS